MANKIIAYKTDSFTDKQLQTWAKSDAAVDRISELALHPKKWMNGELKDVPKTSNIYPSVVRLNGISDTHYSFRVDLTTLLGLSYKDEGKMNTGVNFRLRKDLFDASFHATIDTFLTNFTKFCAWRAKGEVWATLRPHTSTAIQKMYTIDKPPSIYFNTNTAFNGTLLSMPKLEKTGVELPEWLNKGFVVSCITPGFVFDRFALAYTEEATKIQVGTETLEVVQKVPSAFSYEGLKVQSFASGGVDLSNDTTSLFQMAMEEAEGLAPSDVKATKLTDDEVKKEIKLAFISRTLSEDEYMDIAGDMQKMREWLAKA